MRSVSKLIHLPLLSTFVFCDTPANCSTELIPGTWNLTVGPSQSNRYFNCLSLDTVKTEEEYVFTLKTPNIVVDSNNKQIGRWTMMVYEGLEIYAKGLHFNTFFKYTLLENGSYVTDCSETMVGWVRRDKVHPKHISCFSGKKSGNSIAEGVGMRRLTSLRTRTPPTNPPFFVKEGVRMVTDTLTLAQYHEIEDSLEQANPFTRHPVEPAPSSLDSLAAAPAALDWRNVSNVDYVSGVYSQLKCGSCYSFAAFQALEARLKIASKGRIDVSLSEMEVVACSVYSQGCDGGYPQEVFSWAKDHAQRQPLFLHPLDSADLPER
ncbi:putative Dipeptidyl peptidase 1 [Blattamonas nauphoetae]|uniref:Dipeptidyl peptidase 1 n=1 Tax=Blattamonas nauphoetae TaxID=2049346 RepID=A0ABQ9YE18_9EUKA|nr:putative Dipeptidyl peptidase 1 [Blattamonas nauphoetae]